MDNEKYKLNIRDKEVDLFSKFLWYWDLKESSIWLIWNEEWLKDENENLLDRIIDNKLNCDSSDILKRKENDWFFTKSFSKTYECIEWDWYKIMERFINPNLDKLAILELYFLPAINWSEIWKKYWLKNIDNRKEFYQKSKLEKLLFKRFLFIKNLINNKLTQNKTIYFYWLNEYKKDLLFKNIWIFDEIWFLEYKEKNKNGNIQKWEVFFLKYNNNKIFIIPFITFNFLDYDIFSKIDILYNEFVNKKFNIHIKNWWNHYDDSYFCDICKWRVVSKIWDNDITIFKCVECWHSY